jgi:hypothetical protein
MENHFGGGRITSKYLEGGRIETQVSKNKVVKPQEVKGI